jgi:hypothetical protein
MNLTTDHLADILIGIARAQNAVIDAIDRANPGFRSQHASPLITLAANMRAGNPRMIDLSSRILMRLQGLVALDAAAVKADLERLMGGAPAAAPPALWRLRLRPRPWRSPLRRRSRISARWISTKALTGRVVAF